MQNSKSRARRPHRGSRRPCSSNAAAKRVSRSRLEPTVLELLGPSPVELTESVWRQGIAALFALGSAACDWPPGIQVAAILTLAENRPGTSEFWRGVRARTLGWPAVLLSASAQLAEFPEGRSAERQAELALYMASRFLTRASFSCLEGKYLRELREPLEVARVRALQATFIGRLLRNGEIPEEEWAPVRRRTPSVRILVTAADGSRISIALEKAFFEDVTCVLGDKGARAIAREVAETYVPGAERASLSSVVHDELAMILSENLLAARVLGVKNTTRFENPTLLSVPRPRKPRSQDKRSPDDIPYHRNTSVIVNCAYQKGRGTAVSLPRALYGLACERLGKHETHETFRHAAEAWDPESTELSRSQAARYALLLELCRAMHSGRSAQSRLRSRASATCDSRAPRRRGSGRSSTPKPKRIRRAIGTAHRRR